jgi:hypothetical protein
MGTWWTDLDRISRFVGIRMGGTLRPFIGSPGVPVRFFRSGDRENAYVIVARMIVNPGAH